MEKVLHKLFWAHFFGRPHRSNGTKIHLDAALYMVFILKTADIMLSRRNFVYLINKIKMFCLDK